MTNDSTDSSLSLAFSCLRLMLLPNTVRIFYPQDIARIAIMRGIDDLFYPVGRYTIEGRHHYLRARTAFYSITNAKRELQMVNWECVETCEGKPIDPDCFFPFFYKGNDVEIYRIIKAIQFARKYNKEEVKEVHLKWLKTAYGYQGLEFNDN